MFFIDILNSVKFEIALIKANFYFAKSWNL